MLDSIVVNSVTGAEACMAFLREHNVGRANFIALEKVRTEKGLILPGMNMKISWSLTQCIVSCSWTNIDADWRINLRL